MSQPAIPVATAYQPPAKPASPITAAEVATLAGRMRLEARLPRITAVGAVLGLVCGAVTLWPFVESDEYLLSAMTRGGVGGWTSALVPLLLSGLLLLLAFYSLRLQFQSSRATFGAVEDNLRKARLCLVACMGAALGSISGVLSQPERAGDLFLAGLYAGCCAACGIVVCDVRKSLGEFETPEERRRRRMARGFEVEFRSRMDTAAPPLAVLPLEAAGTSARPASSFNAPAMSSALREALPLAASPPALPQHPMWGADHAERDLRTILHLLAGIGIALYVLWIPRLTHFGSVIQSVSNMPGGPFGAPNARDNVTTFLFMLNMVIAACGAAWVIWGVIVLGFGARLRVWVLSLAWFTLACVVIYSVTYIGLRVVTLEADQSRRGMIMGGGVSRGALLDTFSLFPRLPELLYAIVMCVVLTRPRVRDLFWQGSESGEAE